MCIESVFRLVSRFLPKKSDSCLCFQPRYDKFKNQIQIRPEYYCLCSKGHCLVASLTKGLHPGQHFLLFCIWVEPGPPSQEQCGGEGSGVSIRRVRAWQMALEVMTALGGLVLEGW